MTGQITNGYIAFAWFVIYCAFTHYPEQVYLDMLDSNLQNHLEFNIIQFVFEQNILPVQVLNDHILNVLSKRTAEGYRIYNYLKFIETQKIQEAEEKKSPFTDYFTYQNFKFETRKVFRPYFVSLTTALTLPLPRITLTALLL
ncbi:MAG: hypothetical protein IPJ40_12130 [Saprospirales bacterium]|nr:hypothetical protein [Saprospirales bacterium]